jgi:putative aldouronate transport system permease protein
MNKKKKKFSLGDFIMDLVIFTILIFLTFICFYPIWFVLMASFSGSAEITAAAGVMFWPKSFNPKAYVMVFESPLFVSGFTNSIEILLLSLPINIALTAMCGYFLACTGMMFKKPLVYMLLLTMYFGGGMIPGYLNIKDLGLFDTIWALVLPGAVSVYNSIICKTAIEAIPDSLRESAYIDGANDFQIIWKIILPLIKPTLAVLTLYYGVGHWNAWFNASIYLRSNDKLPIQNVLRSVLLANTENTLVSGDFYDDFAETIKYAAIIVSTVPILCVYPFLQKYFAKGAMIGAVKG